MSPRRLRGRAWRRKAVEHRRVDDPRAEGVHADAARGVVERQRFGQHHDGALRGTVHRRIGLRHEPRLARGEENHAALGLLEHDGNRAPRGVQRALHVHVQHPVDFVVGALREELGQRDTRVAEQDVEAGITLPKLLPQSADDEIDRVLDVNVKGPLYAARRAIPIMLQQAEGGVILFTASKTGLVAQTDSPVYCASKGAVVMLAKALALDYAPRGIRVNALCPGIIDTPMLHRFADAMPDPAAAWATYAAAQPLGRLGTPEECAAAAVWLVSPEASFVTGVALPVDGGFTAM